MLTTYYTRERMRTMYAAAPAGPYLDEFSQWLEQRGFTTRTIRRCLFGATQFTLWAAAAGIAVQRLDATHLEEFRCYLAQHGQRQYASGNPTPRCMGAHHFFAFLNAQGIVSAFAVVAPSSPPPTLLTAFEHWMDVHRGVTAQTRRNYRPILLDLLTTLVVSGKSRRETRLPLPQDVGDALLHYLEYARPPVDIDRVFITVMAPWGPISRSVIRQTAARAIQRAGISAPTSGSRVFRHSAATTMLRQGASLQTIGDILRHTSIETSAHYAKVDIDLLQQVARPWPEVALC